MTSLAGGATPTLPGPGAELGAYRLSQILGEGGMGVVYLAEHTRLGRTVALKLLRPELAGDRALAARFVAEARAVNRLEHPNVIEVTDIVEGEFTYYIMERLRGESLAALVRKAPLPVAVAVDIAGQLAAALAAVHDADIVHCDVKPDNVFIETGDGGAPVVKLIDFGIARLPGEEAAATGARGAHARSTADLVGTPAYLSPEQADGGEVTYESDVYSFGVVLYELATGRRPFEADTIDDMVLMHLSVTPRPPGEASGRALPRSLEDLIMHCLAKRPDERPTSMNEVELRIARARDEVVRAAAAVPAPAAPRHRRKLIIAGAGGAVAVATLAAVLVASRGPATPDRAPGEPAAAAPTSTPAAASPPAPGGEAARAPRADATRTPEVNAPPPRTETPRPTASRPRASTPARAPAVRVVNVTLDSAPRGAAVKDSAGKLVCVTPCQAGLSTGRAQTLVFVLPGHAEVTRKVVPEEGGFVAVSLEAGH